MSVRFFKIFSWVLLAHLIVFSLVWIGFSAPSPRPPAVFTYEGALPLEDSSSEDTWQKSDTSDQLTLDQPETSYSNQWTMIRSPSKPITYDHLGF